MYHQPRSAEHKTATYSSTNGCHDCRNHVIENQTLVEPHAFRSPVAAPNLTRSRQASLPKSHISTLLWFFDRHPYVNIAFGMASSALKLSARSHGPPFMADATRTCTPHGFAPSLVSLLHPEVIYRHVLLRWRGLNTSWGALPRHPWAQPDSYATSSRGHHDNLSSQSPPRLQCRSPHPSGPFPPRRLSYSASLHRLRPYLSPYPLEHA